MVNSDYGKYGKDGIYMDEESGSHTVCKRLPTTSPFWVFNTIAGWLAAEP